MRDYKAVLLDRDGVVNFESNDYIKSPQEWHPIPGSIEAITKLTQRGVPVIIVTNQSGVGRGLYDEATLADIHQKMLTTIESQGGKIRAIYHCPHVPSDQCECRKPNPGMVKQALKELNLAAEEVVLIGDSLRDIVAAQTCGCDAVVVMTGYGAITQTKVSANTPIYGSLAEWVEDFLTWQSKHFQ